MNTHTFVSLFFFYNYNSSFSFHYFLNKQHIFFKKHKWSTVKSTQVFHEQKDWTLKVSQVKITGHATSAVSSPIHIPFSVEYLHSEKHTQAKSSLAGGPHILYVYSPLPWPRTRTQWLAKKDEVLVEYPETSLMGNQNLYWCKKCLPTPNTLLKISHSFFGSCYKAKGTWEFDVSKGGTLPF